MQFSVTPESIAEIPADCLVVPGLERRRTGQGSERAGRRRFRGSWPDRRQRGLPLGHRRYAFAAWPGRLRRRPHSTCGRGRPGRFQRYGSREIPGGQSPVRAGPEPAASPLRACGPRGERARCAMADDQAGPGNRSRRLSLPGNQGKHETGSRTRRRNGTGARGRTRTGIAQGVRPSAGA